MGLGKSPGNYCQKIIFTPDDNSVEPLMQEESPAIKWSSFFEDDNFSLHKNDRTDDIWCNIGRTKNNKNNYLKMFYSLSPIYIKIIKSGGFPFHTALVERNGKGALLSAPGGTGKSTCCRRIPSPWRALCDDEALICRLDDGHYEAHPFPTWSDYMMDREKKTWNVQEHVEVKAVFFLKQSPQERIEPIVSGKAALLMYDAAIAACNRIFSYLDKEEQLKIFKKVFNNALEMSKKVPAYELKVSIDGKFWELIDALPTE